MLDKKKECIAEALDEVRDEYIDEAVNYEAKKKRNWKYWATPVAACLVLVIALGIGVRFMPGESDKEYAAAGSAAEVMDGGKEGATDLNNVIGNESSTPADSAPEAGAEDPTENVGAAQQEGVSSGSSLMWYDPEEIFAQDIVIFRGTVESIVQVEGTPLESETGSVSYTQLTVTVTECLKGDLEAGEACVIKLPVKIDYQNYYSDYYGDLTRLSEGSEAIFMPRVGEPYYFSEGRRYLFLETMEGVSYAEEVYEIPSEGAVTLDDVEAYIREILQ